MLTEFTIGNFRSFKSPATLSLVAEQKLLHTNKSRVVRVGEGFHILPSSGIFGANASGKSNIIKALLFMHQLVGGNPVYNDNPASEHSDIGPFLLDGPSRNKPVFMEIVFWDGATRKEYCYGFKLKNKQIVEEWLALRGKAEKRTGTREIFRRETVGKKTVFHFKNRSIGARLGKLTQFVKPEVSAIFVFNQFADPFSSTFFNMMQKNVVTLGGGFAGDYMGQSIDSFKNDAGIQAGVKEIISQADLSIQDLRPVETQVPYLKLAEEQRRKIEAQQGIGATPSWAVYQDIQTIHKRYGKRDTGNEVGLSLQNHESAGTRKLFCLATLLVKVLRIGGVAIIDDLDSELHPLIVKAIVDQFDNKATNPKAAQLIYNTHETFLMSNMVNLRRDQIWLTEKDEREESKLIRLSDYKIRDDYRIDRNYIVGRFGGIPQLEFEEPDSE